MKGNEKYNAPSETIIHDFETRRSQQRRAIRRLWQQKLGLIISALVILAAWARFSPNHTAEWIGILLVVVGVAWRQIELESKVARLERTVEELRIKPPASRAVIDSE